MILFQFIQQTSCKLSPVYFGEYQNSLYIRVSIETSAIQKIDWVRKYTISYVCIR